MDISSNSSIRFTFNQSNFDTPYCFPVQVEDDEVVENTEFFGFRLRSIGVGVNFKSGLHTVKIIDDDSKELTVIQYHYSIHLFSFLISFSFCAISEQISLYGF